MSKEIIENLIKLNNEDCPELTYSNPLLDRNVTTAVSKSVMNILWNSSQIGKKQNVRASVLQTVRNMSKSAPEGHVEVDEDLTGVMVSFYEKQLQQSTGTNNIYKQLDAFLIRNLKSTNLQTSFKSSVNPEVLQAMLNMKENVFTENIINNIIHWNDLDQRSSSVLQNLWNEDVSHKTFFYDNVAIKMKSKIESILLNISHRLLDNGINDIDILFSERELCSLVNVCSISAETFQICTSILNSLFIMTDYNGSIENFILHFILNVKLKVKVTISVLYPYDLSSLVTILDITLDEFPDSVKESYVNLAKNQLTSLHKKSEKDLIMLLSHFPLWFDIYFDK